MRHVCCLEFGTAASAYEAMFAACLRAPDPYLINVANGWDGNAPL